MNKRRTNKDNESNNKILHKLFEENKEFKESRTAEIIWFDLRDRGYIGSYPYISPTCYKNYWIKKVPYERDTYSIFKVK